MSVENNTRKRVTIKYKNPNPLFEKWLEEWKDEAAARGSQMQFCFAKALASLKKYPLPLDSGKECGILQNFGNRLCIMLDRKLAEHKKQNPENVPGEDSPSSMITTSLKRSEKELYPKNQLCNTSDNIMNLNDGYQENKNTKKARKEKKSPNSKTKRRSSTDYVPAHRSGPYAILLGLLSCSKDEGYPGFTTKMDLIKVAQPLCDSSFSKPENGSYFTAWSSMSALIKKGFVSSVGRGKYTLTATGEHLAFKLQSVTKEQDDPNLSSDIESEDIKIIESIAVPTCSIMPTISDVVTLQSTSSNKPGKRKWETETSSVIFQPGSFEVILLIDTHETSGMLGKAGCNFNLLHDLQKRNVVSEVRHLKVGDFVWICRDKTSGHELVLPYIIERKRIDDFAKSIMDGRFREQKFRLKRSGIPHLIYLVEKHGKESHTALPLSTLNQAAANTSVIDGFIVKYTGNHKESALYLAYFSQFLSNLFMPKTLGMCKKDDLPPFCLNDEIVSLMSFKEFNSSSSKTKKLCVRDMFIKQLLKLNGLSFEKAVAIVDRYPTPHALHIALKKDRDIKLIADIPYGLTKRRIGPVVSKVITELYTNSVLM